MKTNTPCAHPSIVQLEQGDKITTQCTRCGKKMKVVKKPSCSCYGGFDCEVCNPDYYEEMKPTDTPLDACPHCGDKRDAEKFYKYECGTIQQFLSVTIRTELCHQTEVSNIWMKRAEKAEAEVERLNSELSDMECEVWPEMARLKAEVAFWKAKAHEAEDREGKHEAEVERLKKTSRSRDRALAAALNEVTRLEQRIERLNESFELALTWVPTPSKIWIKAPLNRPDK